jgi:hypothetical protein
MNAWLCSYRLVCRTSRRPAASRCTRSVGIALFLVGPRALAGGRFGRVQVRESRKGRHDTDVHQARSRFRAMEDARLDEGVHPLL